MSSIAYRKQTVHVWNEIAPRYHRRVKAGGTGPFECTEKMLSMTGISGGQNVLDVACGTGAVSRPLVRRVGKKGLVVGADASSTALHLARKYVSCCNFRPVLCDIQFMRFSGRIFDAATCQFGLFFFADAQKALKNIRRSLKRGGTLAMTVHGRNTPFYTSILDAVGKYVPEYREAGTPDMTRFNTKSSLSRQARNAGFTRVRAREFTFVYSPGTFEQYWRGYLSYAPKASREKISSLKRAEKIKLKRQVMENASPYEKNGTIRFPWQVVIAVAENP